jgi:hypothetical protein
MKTWFAVSILIAGGIVFLPSANASTCGEWQPSIPPTSFPTFPPPGYCQGDPGDPSGCPDHVTPWDPNYGSCADPCMPEQGTCYCQEPNGISYQCPGNTCQPGYYYCWSDACSTDPSLQNTSDCSGQPGAPGCYTDGILPMIPGVNTGSYCQGGQGGDGVGYGHGGDGGVGCEAQGGIIIAIAPIGSCQGGNPGHGGPGGRPGVGGAGCEAFIVIEFSGCFGGPGAPNCIAFLYAGTTCGVGGGAFCQTPLANRDPQTDCQVVPSPVFVCASPACEFQGASVKSWSARNNILLP